MTLAERPHPFPSRTRKLSSPAPKILRGQPFGKIGRRQGPFPFPTVRRHAGPRQAACAPSARARPCRYPDRRDDPRIGPLEAAPHGPPDPRRIGAGADAGPADVDAPARGSQDPSPARPRRRVACLRRPPASSDDRHAGRVHLPWGARMAGVRRGRPVTIAVRRSTPPPPSRSTSSGGSASRPPTARARRTRPPGRPASRRWRACRTDGSPDRRFVAHRTGRHRGSAATALGVRLAGIAPARRGRRGGHGAGGRHPRRVAHRRRRDAGAHAEGDPRRHADAGRDPGGGRRCGLSVAGRVRDPVAGGERRGDADRRRPRRSRARRRRPRSARTR